MPRCLLGLGSNLGDRALSITRSLEQLSAHPKIKLVAKSSLSPTEPVGGPSEQGEFLNGAALIETTLDPHALLAVLHQTEAQLGRRREVHWGPRTIDLDLLLYGESVIDTADLRVPHPLMSERRFVLEPAAEIAPEMIHPLLGRTVAELLQRLNESQQNRL